MEIRQGIKEFSSWPTIPQVYVQGEFMGGSDILIEMYNSGELKRKTRSGVGQLKVFLSSPGDVGMYNVLTSPSGPIKLDGSRIQRSISCSNRS